jgi:asparagine synthase (glutamine-hydrolysing)
MCGIAGAVGAVVPEVAEAVSRMGRALFHRGPDDSGTWTDSRSVAFAHQRLSIVDLSANGHQPMVDDASGCVVAYNGEVYNFAELRTQLEALGHEFRSRTDTEVVLKAYVQWGEGAIGRLRGMFALAIWDPAERRVLLVRDRMGVKPLYWTHVSGPGGRVLLFSSELRGLLGSGLVERRLDREARATYLWSGFVNGSRAIVEGVRSIAPGALAWVDPDEPDVCEKRYWELPVDGAPGGSAEELGEELREAVAMRLVSDVPLGVFLSGGIDSSVVTALATKAAGGGIRTFNIAFDEADYDESPHARAVAESLGTEHTEVRLTQSAFREGIGDALGSLDQPSFDQLNTFFVSRAVREAGITVALAGAGGDELFGGYTSFRDLPGAARWSRRLACLPDGLLRSAARGVTRARMGRFGEVPPQVRWGKLEDVLTTGGDLVDLYQVSYAMFTQAFHGRLVDEPDDVVYGLGAARRRDLERLIEGVHPLAAISNLELSSFLGERLLRDCDAASRAVSLELRVPLVDHRVVEEVARVPTALRYEPLGKRMLLRRLGLGDLDPALFDRPKSGFVLPFDVWIREEMRETVAETLLDRELCAGAGLRPEPVAALWRSFVAGAPGIYWSRIWSLFVLLWWSRKHGVRVS